MASSLPLPDLSFRDLPGGSRVKRLLELRLEHGQLILVLDRYDFFVRSMFDGD